MSTTTIKAVPGNIESGDLVRLADTGEVGTVQRLRGKEYAFVRFENDLRGNEVKQWCRIARLTRVRAETVVDEPPMLSQMREFDPNAGYEAEMSTEGIIAKMHEDVTISRFGLETLQQGEARLSAIMQRIDGEIDLLKHQIKSEMRTIANEMSSLRTTVTDGAAVEWGNPDSVEANWAAVFNVSEFGTGKVERIAAARAKVERYNHQIALLTFVRDGKV